MKIKYNKTQGFTLIEIIVSLAIFVIIAAGVLGSYAALAKSVKLSRQKTEVANLANNYMELLRNLPYSKVGTATGNPNGSLPDYTNPIVKKIESTNYKIYFEVTYIDDPADGLFPADLAANDSKQVKMTVKNTDTGDASSFVTTVSPKGLEGTSNAGALWVKVFNSQGQPVSGANVHIEYPTTTPTIILDRSTDSSGSWVEVNLPAAVNQYRIVVTKPGYSTDRTYPISGSNINPIKPDQTIIDGQITQPSFSIDLLSSLNIKTLDDTCHNLSGINLNIRGSKIIGTNPDVLKYDENFASASGQINLTNLEWDTYTPTLLTGQGLVVKGTSPIQKIDVLPNTTQTFTLNLAPNSTGTSLLVIVKDAGTGVALEGAKVTLSSSGFEEEGYTGGSIWFQSDWSSGSGLVNWDINSQNQYFQDDGNVDISGTPTGVRLKKVGINYQTSGWLESSSFDTGTSLTNYTTLSWQPTSQDPETEIKFQLAANNDNAVWNYVGPDGTDQTFYTVPGSNISNALDNKRYFRYKVFFATSNSLKTPVLTSVTTNFVTGCFTPGQYLFNNLIGPKNYDLQVELDGYQEKTIPQVNVNGNQALEVLLSP